MGRPNQRNDTFRKRKKGLKKKASEFSILCGVDTCLVSFSPNGDLDIWPEDKSTTCMNVVQRERLSMGNVGVVQKMEEQEVREIERGEMINPHLLNQLLPCNFPVMNVEPISMKPSENLGRHDGLYGTSENLGLHEGVYKAGEMEQFQNVNFGVRPLMGFDPKNTMLTPL
ncbi:hypothetical protein AMTR_s00025p00208390 [Amborella trichopoda]|uniref:MADS-box domain-containing protein n=1 Tax=Amborella trichopoda TaxID=13333 RepID=W1PR94_AMBTC|nr:hypothetical protein AMTR_s00025p00208390 [Amborella trichopoda]